jgi:hypothetical protein
MRKNISAVKSILIAAGMAGALAMGGCASKQPADATLSCQNQKDCAAKWSRALVWVARRSAWRIQTQSDSVIQTFGPVDVDARTGYTVTKTTNLDGSGVIEFSAACGNAFRCTPPPSVAQTDFFAYVAR